MRIYFVRHGESQANLLHVISNRGLRHGLTLNGREQVRRLSRRLQAIPFTRIYSSPLLRAVETSIIVADQLGLEYEVTEALREFDCGVMEGRSDEEAWNAWRELFDAWTLHQEWEQHIEDGENFIDIRRRFVPFIESLSELYGHTSSNLLCVGHGGLYWLMLPLVLQNIEVIQVRHFNMDNTVCIVAELRPAGLICVEWHGQTISMGKERSI
jgi:broad specificity phosphatase PhoE